MTEEEIKAMQDELAKAKEEIADLKSKEAFKKPVTKGNGRLEEIMEDIE